MTAPAWDAAADAFERVLRLDAERPEARLGLGGCLLEMNRAEEACGHFDRSRAGRWLEPALFGKAAALQLLGHFEEASRLYAGLLASDSNSQEVLSNWIAMGIEIHDLAGVREHSQRLLDICPDSEVALRGLVTAALEDGDHQTAAVYCGRLLELAPDCLEAWHNFRIAMEQFRFGSAQPELAVCLGGKV